MLSIDAVDTHETEKPSDRRNNNDQVNHRGIAVVINLLAQLLTKEQTVALGPDQAHNDTLPTSEVNNIHLSQVDDELRCTTQ
jgi:hypothetical protein